MLWKPQKARRGPKHRHHRAKRRSTSNAMKRGPLSLISHSTQRRSSSTSQVFYLTATKSPALLSPFLPVLSTPNGREIRPPPASTAASTSPDPTSTPTLHLHFTIPSHLILPHPINPPSPSKSLPPLSRPQNLINPPSPLPTLPYPHTTTTPSPSRNPVKPSISGPRTRALSSFPAGSNGAIYSRSIDDP